GTLVLSGRADIATRNTMATAATTVQAGSLKLDYESQNNNNSKLSDRAPLTLGGSRLGGTLELLGGNHIEIVSGVTLGNGDDEIVRPNIGNVQVVSAQRISPIVTLTAAAPANFYVGAT